jgi:YggT family protein
MMFAQISELLVDALAGLVVFVLLARFLMQWLRVSFRNPAGEFIIATTNWAVLPLRHVIPSVAGLDLASLTAAWLAQMLALWALSALRGSALGPAPGIAAAILAAVALVDLIRFSCYILAFAVIVQAVLSWVNPYSPVAPIFDAMTRPFLRPVRRFVPPLANVDLSPLVLLILLQVLLIPLAHLRALAGGVF